MYLLAVIAGGGCGALVRFMIANCFNNTSFPLGTLIANTMAITSRHLLCADSGTL